MTSPRHVGTLYSHLTPPPPKWVKCWFLLPTWIVWAWCWMQWQSENFACGEICWFEVTGQGLRARPGGFWLSLYCVVLFQVSSCRLRGLRTFTFSGESWGWLDRIAVTVTCPSPAEFRSTLPVLHCNPFRIRKYSIDCKEVEQRSVHVLFSGVLV